MVLSGVYVVNSSCFSHQIKWLETEAPRYTSYPSALYFQPLTSDTYQQWLQKFDLEQSVALYIHIPFCNQLCWFCGCHTKVSNQYSPIAFYVRSLIQEIELISKTVNGKIKLHSIHFGGGSPTILTSEDMENIFKSIHAVFAVQNNAEIAIEIDPRHITKDKILTYKQLGFNRASLGVQDTNEKVQAAIHRIQSFNQIRRTCEMLREEGIHAINMDLIYGLPFQSLQSIEQTINQICTLQPSRIAYYSFAHVPWIKKHHKLISENDLPSPKEKGTMYLHASNIFEKNNYQPLGIDHFSRPEDECYISLNQRNLRRNFMGYTTGPKDSGLGVGASAISNLGAGLSQNNPNDPEYKDKIKQGQLPTLRGWTFSPDDYLRKAIINDLMCYFYVDLTHYLTQYHYPLDYFDKQLKLLSPFCETGVISITDRCIQFNSPFRMIVRSVCAVFDEYHLTRENTKYLKVS